MCDRARPIVTLLIAPDSPLAKGRLPKDASGDEAGIRAAFDPISYALLRASLGEFISLEEVRAMFEEAMRKALGQRSVASADGGSNEEGAA